MPVSRREFGEEEQTGATLIAPASSAVASDVPAEMEEVIRLFEGPLLRYALRMLWPDQGAAQDVVQETFLRFFRQWYAAEEPLEDLSGWLFAVARNLIQDRLRRLQRERQHFTEAPSAAVSAPDGAPLPLEQMIRRAAGERALEELKNLPLDLREVLLLNIIQGLPLRRVASLLNVAVSRVSGRLTRGLEELARRLKEGGAL